MQIEIPRETWRDRIDILLGRRRDLWLVAAVAGLAVIAAVGLWARGRPIVAPPAEAPPVAAGMPATPDVVLVHIGGAVVHPGLYELPAGSRIADAIGIAGGPRGRAYLDALNLAEIVIDGSKIVVPRRGDTLAPGTEAVSEPERFSLNSATAAELEAIPGVGPVLAQAIVDHRGELGGFEDIDQLLDVDGIGPAVLESIRSYLTL